MYQLKFQFTHPGRGATEKSVVVLIHTHVSIHAPREGCDGLQIDSTKRPSRFNSRTPGGVRRSALSSYLGYDLVSIHAPREGCDAGKSQQTEIERSFNSRTPGGVRPRRVSFKSFSIAFQFTHPGRGATEKERILNRLQRVSIHAPREGCDSKSVLVRVFSAVSIHAPREGCDRKYQSATTNRLSFNSRTPGGVRHPRETTVA